MLQLGLIFSLLFVFSSCAPLTHDDTRAEVIIHVPTIFLERITREECIDCFKVKKNQAFLLEFLLLIYLFSSSCLN